jgi:hypothetical protein
MVHQEKTDLKSIWQKVLFPMSFYLELLDFYSERAICQKEVIAYYEERIEPVPLRKWDGIPLLRHTRNGPGHYRDNGCQSKITYNTEKLN